MTRTGEYAGEYEEEEEPLHGKRIFTYEHSKGVFRSRSLIMFTDPLGEIEYTVQYCYKHEGTVMVVVLSDADNTERHWNFVKFKEESEIEPILLENDFESQKYHELELLKLGLEQCMAKHRRDILWLSFAAVTGVVAAAIATKVGVEQISDRNHWDFDLKRWQNNLLKNGVDTSIIHPKACERMYKMGIYFDGDAFVLPDGDRMYVRKDNDVSVALMTLEISALDEQKVLIHSTERNKDDFLLRNDIRIIQSDGTRISGKHSAFATWQDRCLLSGTQVDVFNAQFANQWRRRGITNDAEGNIVMQSGQTIPLLGRNSDLRPPHRIECDHDFNTDTMSITFYEWNTASTTIEKRTAYIDARGSVQR